MILKSSEGVDLKYIYKLWSATLLQPEDLKFKTLLEMISFTDSFVLFFTVFVRYGNSNL